MHNYHFQVRINRRYNNAGSKATDDCKEILVTSGYIDLEISFIKAWYLLPVNLVKLFATFLYYLYYVKSNSLIVVQYPLLGINKFFPIFIRILRRKGCMFCAIIHDLESLREEYNKDRIEDEISTLNAYDAVISHNNAMSNWLTGNGYKGHIEEITLFDYLVKEYKPKKTGGKNAEVEIAFAGTFKRGVFLKKLIEEKFPFYLNLYGNGFEKTMSERNPRIRWIGSFTPDEVVTKLTGDFGLVWDGDSVEEITGLTGNYLKYNTPHKTSLYLTAGLPVIVSKNAALAAYIQENNLGFSVSSLSEIYDKVQLINDGQYAQMRKNAFETGEKLSKGYNLLSAINKIKYFIESRMRKE